MANNILTSLVPTIFAQGLKSLRTNCVMPSMVNSDFSNEVAQKGDTIQIPVPSAMTVSDVVPGPVAPVTQAATPTTAKIPLSNWKESAFTLTEKELAQIVGGYVPKQLTSAVEALASAINASIFTLHTGIYGYVGTAGTTPFLTDLTASTSARKVLGIQRAPTQNRRIVLNPDAEANALGLPQFTNAFAAADSGIIHEGVIGRKLGFDWMMDQQVPTHTSGTITTGLVAKAATAVPAGTFTFLATTAASTGACALNVGDIVNFAGDSQTYSLQLAAVQPTAATDVSLTILPAKVVPLVGGEAITVKPTHVANLAFHRDAFGFASRPMGNTSLTGNKDESFQVADPVSGLSMRLTYREEFHQTRLAFDVLWGVGVVRPELAVRIAG